MADPDAASPVAEAQRLAPPERGLTLHGWLALVVLVGGAIALHEESVPCRCISNSYLADRQLEHLATAVSAFHADEHRYPPSLEDLSTPTPTGHGPYHGADTSDPWGHAIEYRLWESQGFTLRSYGDDGLPETDDDIVWPPS